jgi:hypothetical protein
MAAQLYQALTQTKALKPAFERLWRFTNWARRTMQANLPDEHSANFIRHNRRKYPVALRRESDPVVLVGQHEWLPSIYNFCLLATHLAARTGARIETFDFHDTRDPLIEKFYRSFGAHRALTLRAARRFTGEAAAMTDRLLPELRTKWDVLNIEFDGIRVGDVIYDTYLRELEEKTVELDDPRLRTMIFEAARLFCAAREYFSRHKVVAVMPWRTVYLKCGILCRLALARQVPVYLMPYRPAFFLQALDPNLSTGMCNPTKRFPYYRYREIFEKLSPEEQAAGRAKARASLAERLSGKEDPGVLRGRSAYTAPTTERILPATGTPKILILLHDFCDAVHSFRHMLFADFYEWAKYTFAQAAETEFEWYAKPHPNSLRSESKNALNRETIAELSAAYPRIRILDGGVSNRQLVQEGIAAAFTVHGTAGHEFAAMGVPVVNAGDNLHVSFDFNLNPRSVEEYARCIAEAGRLHHVVDQAQVEAFYYMHYFYFRENNCSEVNPIEEGWRSDPEFCKKTNPQTGLSYFLKTETPEKMRRLAAYFDQCMTRPPEQLTVKGL